MNTSRRQWFSHALTAGAIALAPGKGRASPEEMAIAMRNAYGDRTISTGRVNVKLPALAENGNSVRMQITVDSPMSDADHVIAVQVFAEANPLPDIVRFELGPLAGSAEIETRIRVAAEQHITAVAEMSDGSLWSGSAHIIVTEAACLDALI